MDESLFFLGDFYPINFILYITIPYDDYVSKKRKNPQK